MGDRYMKPKHIPTHYVDRSIVPGYIYFTADASKIYCIIVLGITPPSRIDEVYRIHAYVTYPPGNPTVTSWLNRDCKIRCAKYYAKYHVDPCDDQDQ